MKNTTYRLYGKNHKAIITNCVRVSNDPDSTVPYWMWTLKLVKPVRLYDGSMLYQTYIRRGQPV